MPVPTARRPRVPALCAPALWLSAALLGCACGGKEPALPHRPPPTRGIPQPRPTNTSTTLPGPSPEVPLAEPPRAQSAETAPKGDPAAAAPSEEPEGSAEPKERNYSAELAALLSTGAASCLTSFRPNGSTVSLQVTAQVMPTGTITRADAQGAGLTPPILSCLKKLAESTQLSAPVRDAPRSVRAQVTLHAQTAPSAPQPTAAAEDPDSQPDERDGDPRNSKIHAVDDDPPEVEQKLYEPSREAPEPPAPVDEPPADNHTD